MECVDHVDVACDWVFWVNDYMLKPLGCKFIGRLTVAYNS